jgi:predicted transcriptional regulator
MSTTSLKLPEDLKQRAASLALELGVTPHAFMVDAIRKAAAAAEKHAEFVAQAKTARKNMLATGKGFAANEVHLHLRERIKVAAQVATQAATQSTAQTAKQTKSASSKENKVNSKPAINKSKALQAKPWRE